MKRILLIQPYASLVGGVDTVLLQLIDGFKHSDLKFFVLIPYGSPYVSKYENLEAKVINFNLSVFSKTKSLSGLMKPLPLLFRGP